MQIIKVSREEDLYMEWSWLEEGPTFIAGRAEMLSHLQVSDDGRDLSLGETYEALLTRADETGSSAPPCGGLQPSWGCHWDDYGEIYQGEYWLPRSEFTEFVRRWLSHEGDGVLDVSDLLVEVERD